MADTRLAYNRPPDNFDPKVFLICSKCCEVFEGTLHGRIDAGWAEYFGEFGLFALCPECIELLYECKEF